jgi:hypothetical protein
MALMAWSTSTGAGVPGKSRGPRRVRHPCQRYRPDRRSLLDPGRVPARSKPRRFAAYPIPKPSSPGHKGRHPRTGRRVLMPSHPLATPRRGLPRVYSPLRRTIAPSSSPSSSLRVTAGSAAIQSHRRSNAYTGSPRPRSLSSGGPAARPGGALAMTVAPPDRHPRPRAGVQRANGARAARPHWMPAQGGHDGKGGGGRQALQPSPHGHEPEGQSPE